VISFPGPCSALVTLPVPPDGAGIERVLMLDRAVQSGIPDLVETVPAFNRLLITGEAWSWDPGRLAARLEPMIAACLGEALEPVSLPTVALPACYEPELAPDLVALAEGAGLTPGEVGALHSGQVYTVLATGFAPGFAYMGDVDPRLAAPRHPSPRPRVEVGSVGIADRRTGLYPAAGPGGWQLIARVPAPWFADAAERIARFQPGARVEFRAIDLRAFHGEGG
jgi:KipI family sensor histidine kinase inhibitor